VHTIANRRSNGQWLRAMSKSLRGATTQALTLIESCRWTQAKVPRFVTRSTRTP
jgi:hypothetical protein